MNNAETLFAVTQQLREIFLEKSELKGFDDWDRFIGCVAAIEQVAQSLKGETVMDGGELNGEPTD